MRYFGFLMILMLSLAFGGGGVYEKEHSASVGAEVSAVNHGGVDLQHDQQKLLLDLNPSSHCGLLCPSIVPGLPDTSEHLEWDIVPHTLVLATQSEGYIGSVPQRPPRI